MSLSLFFYFHILRYGLPIAYILTLWKIEFGGQPPKQLKEFVAGIQMRPKQLEAAKKD